MPTVHLLDASPYLFRAFFSVPKSVAHNAVHGFTSFLVRYLLDHQPTHIGVAFDRHFNQSFRNELYPPYKAQREASPPELEAQVDPAVEVVEAMGIATFIDETHEADDLIATIIHQTRRGGTEYVVISSDKDLAQLVSDRCTLVDPARELVFDAAAVEAKFGVTPAQMTDYLGLCGDAVDNIPGVRGIGPKTAAQLLRDYGSIEAIYENLAKIKQAAKLEPHAEIAALSKRLATVSTESPIEVTLTDLRWRRPDAERVRKLFTRLGFHSLQERVLSI